MNKTKILIRSWCVLSSALTLVIFIGIMAPIVKHIRLKGEKSDIEFIGPYQEDASVRTAISLGQYLSINDKSGSGALIKEIRDIDFHNYIPEYNGGATKELSLLWFYRFTPMKLKRTGDYLEVIGLPNTNDAFCFIIASYEELEDVRIMQTLRSE